MWNLYCPVVKRRKIINPSDFLPLKSISPLCFLKYCFVHDIVKAIENDIVKAEEEGGVSVLIGYLHDNENINDPGNR